MQQKRNFREMFSLVVYNTHIRFDNQLYMYICKQSKFVFVHAE